MSPSVWGPPIWALFHTLAHKIKDESYPQIGVELFYQISRICRYLPCPDCSNHATAFLGKINPVNLKTKHDLIHTYYILHNIVNKRKNKPMYKADSILAKYNEMNIIYAYNHFTSVYKTKGNMKLLTDSFQRQIIVKEFQKWLSINFKHFNP